jgi:hypothetical protein
MYSIFGKFHSIFVLYSAHTYTYYARDPLVLWGDDVGVLDPGHVTVQDTVYKYADKRHAPRVRHARRYTVYMHICKQN